ncbi:MAG: pirin family protein [Chitinophagaceae bacterium]|nr:pirin family protein [Chitinophagaceae bacterium]MCW5926898.1 pirin family protein [Chitinophagaceae bacterium]
MIRRTIEKKVTGHGRQGFLGEGHYAVAVIDGTDFARTDPFILLMDDNLNLPGGKPVGGPHPHAGFETVTLVIKGDGKEWHTGSMELMTAGKGIIHTEEITGKTSMRILQLWLALPPEQRWAEARWQQLLPEDVPTRAYSNGEIKVYSGSSNGLVSPMLNHTAFDLVDFTLHAGAKAAHRLPAGYNGFIYVLEGSISVGELQVTAGQSGWLNKTGLTSEESEIRFTAGQEDSRFILYAASPHGVPVISHGPFIGDTRDDIVRLYKEYQAGIMPHLNDLPESSKYTYQKESAV